MTSVFFPSKNFIADITKEQYAKVYLEEDNIYIVGEIVSFRVSKPYGMVEMNNLQSQVLDSTVDYIVTDIDSSNFTAFVTPADEDIVSYAMTVPVGSGVLREPTATVILQDAFDNVPID